MPSPKKNTFTSTSLLTSYQVGALLQVNPSSINKWIEDGRIPAFRTPGGHRRIRATDLMNFLVAHNMPIPQGLVLSHKPRSVLAISDDPHLFDGLRQHVPSDGSVLITFAADGVDGLMRLGLQAPDLVVLGPTRAPLDTFDICRRLRATHKAAPLKIAVVLTANNAERTHDAKRAGADVVLALPWQQAELMALLTPAA